MKLFRRSRALAVFLIPVALAVGGCTSSDSGKGNPREGAAGFALKASDINPQPRSKVQDGGMLRWATAQLSTQWNHNHLNGGVVSTDQVMRALMPTIFNIDERAVPTVNTDYLTSADVTSKSPQVVTYKISPKARWSDGKPISAVDFIVQWKALNGRNEAYEVASNTGYDQIESVEQGADDHQVVVRFAKPFSEWQSLFNPLYPASTNDNPDAFKNSYLSKIPVTAGPFKLQRIDQTTKTVTVVRDPNWWGEPAKLDTIVFRAMGSDAALNAFANGEVDLFDVGPNPSAFKRAQAVQGAQIRGAAGPDYRQITFNGTSPLLSDVKVRRAVAVAIDREAITRSGLQGLNWPTTPMNNHFFVPTQEGYQDNAGEAGRFDPEKARKLLDAAGWKLNGQVREKASRKLELQLVIPSGLRMSQQEGQLVQAMLFDVGIKLNIQVVPSDALFDKYISPGNFDITPFSWGGSAFPISSSKSIYINPTKGAQGELQIQQNYARIGSAQIDGLLNQAISELDVVKARDLLNQADKLVWNEVHSLILYQRPQIVAAKATLANYGALGFISRGYQDIGFTL